MTATTLKYITAQIEEMNALRDRYLEDARVHIKQSEESKTSAAKIQNNANQLTRTKAMMIEEAKNKKLEDAGIGVEVLD